jgi:hypothetical protein
MRLSAPVSLHEGIDCALREPARRLWLEWWRSLPEHSGIDPLHPPLPRASSDRLPEAAWCGRLTLPLLRPPVHVPRRGNGAGKPLRQRTAAFYPLAWRVRRSLGPYLKQAYHAYPSQTHALLVFAFLSLRD